MSVDSALKTGLSLPRDTFARLAPVPFLLAHLQQQNPVRPNGRAPSEGRKPTIHIGSLTHSNGSAVARNGDTAVVCGVRAEILLASDIPQPPSEDRESHMEQLGLLVPNVELSTGCSSAHLPGNPPGTLAQSLSYRILSLLHASNLLSIGDLEISHVTAKTDDEHLNNESRSSVKAYWCLYIDVLCIALDGNAFDVAWTAVLAALKCTRIPKAEWNADLERVICSPAVSDSRRLKLLCYPVTSTFALVTRTSGSGKQSSTRSWILADPDAFEEEICDEVITLTTLNTSSRGVLKIEKAGSVPIDKAQMTGCLDVIERQRSQLYSALGLE